MNIAITDNMGSEEKLQKYSQWLVSGDSSVNIIVLSYLRDNISELSSCEGLVLTGGNDVDPSLYGGNVRHPKLGLLDYKRDDFERKVLDKALDRSLPILGICRGLQIANVHFGGTLIPDIIEQGHPSHESTNGTELRHQVTLTETGLLSKIVGTKSGEINSCHHQAADKPGKNLRSTGFSNDGIIEALEFNEGGYPAFFHLVQWHPERMKDSSNPFCKNILDSFITSTKQKIHINI